MSDDLVKRLRELNTFEWHARPATTIETCFAAASRIEKLEAALREIAHLDYRYAATNFAAYDAHNIARKALEGKDERV